ncbi:NineTeen Complex (NTC) component [Clydaea vesicula]|uniref:NineTeen Complex (NTC) component n=1 Tax=Clydaea vesicula TaxID=447962 RepID=A0AAD5U8H3_9FUNG|nr:NineTeen Complex (NTC) component [Clydaea vesicula]
MPKNNSDYTIIQEGAARKKILKCEKFLKSFLNSLAVSRQTPQSWLTPFNFKITKKAFFEELKFNSQYVNLCVSNQKFIPLPLLFPNEYELDADGALTRINRSVLVVLGRLTARGIAFIGVHCYKKLNEIFENSTIIIPNSTRASNRSYFANYGNLYSYDDKATKTVNNLQLTRTNSWFEKKRLEQHLILKKKKSNLTLMEVEKPLDNVVTLKETLNLPNIQIKELEQKVLTEPHIIITSIVSADSELDQEWLRFKTRGIGMSEEVLWNEFMRKKERLHIKKSSTSLRSINSLEDFGWEMFRAAKNADLNSSKKVQRPFYATDCNSTVEAENWRTQVLREIAKKISLSMKETLSDQQIRDNNDAINKLLREKDRWEVRIKELGGPDHKKTGIKTIDREGREVPGSKGYKYFGRAKELPGIRELFESADAEIPVSKSRKDLYKNVDADYFGYRDEEDPFLLPYEEKIEKLELKNYEREFKKKKIEEEKEKKNESDEELGNLKSEDLLQLPKVYCSIPNQKEIEAFLLRRRKQALLNLYVGK